MNSYTGYKSKISKIRFLSDYTNRKNNLNIYDIREPTSYLIKNIRYGTNSYLFNNSINDNIIFDEFLAYIFKDLLINSHAKKHYGYNLYLSSTDNNKVLFRYCVNLKLNDDRPLEDYIKSVIDDYDKQPDKRSNYMTYIYLDGYNIIVPENIEKSINTADRPETVFKFLHKRQFLNRNTVLSHAHMLIINLLDKTLEFYDPHGISKALQHINIDTLLKTICYDLRLKYISPSNIYVKSLHKSENPLLMKGLQVLHEFFIGDNKTDKGYCQVWCLFYLFNRLTLPKLNPKVLTRKLTTDMIRSPEYFHKTINNFSKILISILVYYRRSKKGNISNPFDIIIPLLFGSKSMYYAI